MPQGQRAKNGEGKLNKIPLEYFTTCATDSGFIDKNMTSIFKTIETQLDIFLDDNI